MGWKAEATVVSVNEGDVVLTAFGSDVTSDGDDNVTSVTVEVNGPEASHLTVGTKVEIIANC